MPVPRMLTINECAKEFEGTGLTAYRLRQLALTNQIINIRAGKKILINADKLIEYLNNPPLNMEQSPQAGEIRPVQV